MKRIALVGLLLSFAAGTASAQTAPLSMPQDVGSQRVILKGVSADGRIMPAGPVITRVTPPRESPTPKIEIPTPQVQNESTQAPEAPAPANDHSAPANDNGGPRLAKCDGCGQEWTDCCCDCPGWMIFGEYLLLQPKGFDSVFALRGPICSGGNFFPTGAEQIDFDSSSGFKIGLGKMLCDGVSQIVGSYTHFEASESERANATAPGVLFPILVFDPFANCDVSTTTGARASASIDFDRAELDYRRNHYVGCSKFDWLVGFAYGQLNTDLTARYTGGDRRIVRAESDAYGYGIHVGGGGDVALGCLRGFAHVDLTLLDMNTNASFRHAEPLGVAPIVADVDQDLDRIVPILDLQFGVAYEVCCNLTLKVGYTYSIWYNVVLPESFIDDVQRLHFPSNSGDTLTFDGLFARLEYAW